MKNFRRITRAMIRKIQERGGFTMPVVFMSRWGLYDIDTACELAREYAKTAGMSIKTDAARFDPVITERVDTKSYFRIVRKKIYRNFTEKSA